MTKHFIFIMSCFVIAIQAMAQKPEGEPIPGFGKTELYITMADGIKLATNVYLPEEKGKIPAIIVRTPYGKDGAKSAAEEFVANGIAVVVQDCRGKYASEGEFYPFINERADGLTTLTWIRKQSWSNGKVGGWGSSYLGYTQWAISDSLEVFSPDLTGSDIYDLIYPDGLFSLQTAFTWGFAMASQQTNPIPSEILMAGLEILPLSVADDSTVKDIPFISDWLTHEKRDNYWQQMNFRGITEAPVISTAGWYDYFLKAQIDDFQAHCKNRHPDCRLIIGPWAHEPQSDDHQYGGKEKTGIRTDIIRDYLISHLKDGGRAILSPPLVDKKYNLFIMERNEYFGSEVWPPVQTETASYFIGPENYLSPESFAEQGNLQYNYDPMDPFPSLGGTGRLGALEQNKNISRQDQLAFETKALENPLVLLGPISASIWLASDASCSDLIVCVQDVYPDGKIINIQEGGAKVQFGGEVPEKKEISIWATGYQLNKGHRLRVTLTSSWFPRYNRNLNSCKSIFSAQNPINAKQMVYYGPDTPSCINLPVLKISER